MKRLRPLGSNVSHGSLIDLISIEQALRAITFLPLADVSVCFVAIAPRHGTIRPIGTRVSQPILEETLVLPLVIGPNVAAFTLADIAHEHAPEGAHVVVILDLAHPTQLAFLIPRARVRALAYLDYSRPNQKLLLGIEISCCRAIVHGHARACFGLVVLPCASDLPDVALFESHLTITMQLVVLDLAVIFDAIVPDDPVLAVHLLVDKDSFVDGRALAVLANMPLVVLEGAFEPAVDQRVRQVCDLALAHVTFLKLALKLCFIVWEA